MLRLHADGLIALPPSQIRQPRRAARFEPTTATDAQRRQNLHRVVNNTRFLILPWVQCAGLASKVRAMAARRLPKDWQHRYGFAPESDSGLPLLRLPASCASSLPLHC